MSYGPEILLVDDDEDIRLTVEDVLAAEGYVVRTAGGGREALELLRAGKINPQILLLDMMMPDIDGWEFLSELRRWGGYPDLPVVVFSAFGNPHEVAESVGAVGCLKKPLRLDELLREVQRLLALSSRAAQPQTP